MGTYSSSSDIIFDNGKPISELLAEDLTASQIEDTVSRARTRAYNKINSRLLGKTAVPAHHIDSLKQVEIDFVLADLIAGAFTMEAANISEWGEKYTDRATDTLDSLTFNASADDPIAFGNNTGDGRMTVIKVNNESAKTELWTFTASSATLFSVEGTVSGRLPDLTVGDYYPDKTWSSTYVGDYGVNSKAKYFNRFPIDCKIIAGDTPFVQGDHFNIWTYAASKKSREISIGRVLRG